MLRTIIIILSLYAGILGSAQTAVNFNCNDCAGNAHDLFAELDAGRVIVLCWVMPCGACIGPSLTANQVVASFDSAHPERVKMYVADDFANTSCSSLDSWLSGTPIKNVTTFSHSSIKMSDYGSDGMPKIVVVAGNDYRVFFNANNTVNGFALRDSIASALAHIALNVPDARTDASEFRVFPNPASERVVAEFTFAEPGEFLLELLDLAGRRLFSEKMKVNAPGYQAFTIPLSGMEPGTYLVMLTDGRGLHYSQRLSVK